eukprot:scaffold6767_cov223-Isochrysis_galbana.AAC.20
MTYNIDTYSTSRLTEIYTLCISNIQQLEQRTETERATETESRKTSARAWLCPTGASTLSADSQFHPQDSGAPLAAGAGAHERPP